MLEDGGFERRPRDEVEREAGEVFSEPEDAAVDDVRVRFAPGVARWIGERYPDAAEGPDGSLTVTYRVASVDWLVRHVLQYGDAAEVVGPEPYRDAITEAVGW